MADLQLPGGENIILSAYVSMKSANQAQPMDFALEYQRYFVTAVEAATGSHGKFERFSLVDPTIRTVIKTTATGI